MRFKDLKIRHKFILSFGIALVMIIALSIGTIIGINKLVDKAEEALEGNNLKALFIQKHEDHLNWALQLSKDIINNNNDLIVQTDAHQCGLGEWYYGSEREKAVLLVPELRSYLREIEKPHQELHQSAMKIKNLLASGNDTDYKEALDIYQTRTLPLLNQVGNLLADMESVVSQSLETDEGMFKLANEIEWVIFFVALFIVLFGGLLAYLIAFNIGSSVRGISAFVSEVGNGNLDAEFDFDQKDEMGQLVISFRQMLARVKEVLVNVSGASQNVTDASMQLSNTSQDISQGASEQASSVEEVSSSVEEMTANIQQNTDNAKQTEIIAAKAAKDIEAGSTKVHTTMEAMKSIANKISIIGDIAFQTNILALNAAVEAARAGEHGKGFGVVAAEVGKLAERSKLAAAEIDEISRKSVDIAEDASAIMKTIVPDIQMTSQLVQEIAAASMEQNAGAEQINNAIQQLNEVTQQNAAASEEMATSAEELSSQADQLLDVISYFRSRQIGKQNIKRKESKPNKAQTFRAQFNNEAPGKNKGVHIDLGDSLDSEFERF